MIAMNLVALVAISTRRIHEDLLLVGVVKWILTSISPFCRRLLLRLLL